MKLKELNPGQSARIVSIGQKGLLRKRLMDMGVTSGVRIKVIKVAPLGDPIEINIRGYKLSLRNNEAENINVEI